MKNDQVEVVKNGVVIHQCTCTGGPAAVYQDAKYGNQMRVFNRGTNVIRCTVCKSEVQVRRQAQQCR